MRMSLMGMCLVLQQAFNATAVNEASPVGDKSGGSQPDHPVHPLLLPEAEEEHKGQWLTARPIRMTWRGTAKQLSHLLKL